MDFSLTEEQLMVRDMARRFAEEQIKPAAAELDKAHRHPAEIVKQMAELKFLGIAVPEEYGGGGMDYLSYVLSMIEISKACASVGVIMSVNNSLYCFPVMAFGTHEQKMKYLAPVASGASLGCYGLTEAGAGSDPSAMRTTATRDGDGWILNGEKKFITNGNVADYCVLAAVTDKGKGYKGISTFVVNLRETPGFSVGVVEDKMGIRASGTAELIFEDARLPGDALLGQEGEGFKQMLTTLDGGRIGIASQALGIGEAALAAAVGHCQQRGRLGAATNGASAGGGLGRAEAALADCATELAAARLLTLRAASRKQQGLPFTREASMAKVYASETAWRVCNRLIQACGADGYTAALPLGRYLRDARVTRIYEGTSEIQRMVIARELRRGCSS
ncbi:MAG: acyl-CoA dehydrogenase family protein [Pseudomonadota bacterium]